MECGFWFQISSSGPVVFDVFIILFIFYPEWDSRNQAGHVGASYAKMERVTV